VREIKSNFSRQGRSETGGHTWDAAKTLDCSIVIGRNHNALANENEKHQAKEFLYENFAFTGALWWDRANCPTLAQ
jgi:hypothetical protein